MISISLSSCSDSMDEIADYRRIFKPGAKLDKHSPFYSIPVLEGGMFNDSKRKTALPRRAMYSPSFSRDAVRRAEPRIIRGFSLLMDKLAQYEKDGEPVDITRGFQCLTNDIAMDYVYQLSMGALEAEGFDSEYIKPAVDMVAMLHWTVYFPNVCGAIFKFTEMLPKWVVDRWLPMISTQKGQLQVRSVLYLNFHGLGHTHTKSMMWMEPSPQCLV